MTDDEALARFDGTARLFPLPNLVLFPGGVQPLHIFEPRYRQMMLDALAGDRLIALALLRPGWEEDYHERPPIHPVACLGCVRQEQRLADGRWNLLLHGIGRIRIEEELPGGTPYRLARARLLEEIPCTEDVEPLLRRELDEGMSACLAAFGTDAKQAHELLYGELPLGIVCDILAYTLPLGAESQQALLAEPGVEARVRRLTAALLKLEPPAGAKARPFPPPFSSN